MRTAEPEELCSAICKDGSGRGVILGRADISERPKEVKEKSGVGHWEADTISGGRGLRAIVSLFD